MSLEEIWAAVALDNAEAHEYFAEHWQGPRPPAPDTSPGSDPATEPAEAPDERPRFAMEVEVQRPAALVGSCVVDADPHRRAERYVGLLRVLVPLNPKGFRQALIEQLVESAADTGPEDGLSLLDEALEHARRLEPPGGADSVAQCLHARAALAIRLGRVEDMLRDLRELVGLDGADPALRGSARGALQSALEQLSTLALHNGEAAEAEALLTELAALLRTPAADDPEARSKLAVTLNNAGSVIFEHDPSRGLALVAEAVAIRRDMAATEPAVFRPALAIALNNLGYLYLRHRDFAAAEEHLAEAVAIRRDFDATDPSTYGPLLLRSLNNLALTRLQLTSAPPGGLLATTAEACGLARRRVAEEPHDIVLPLVHFAQARLLHGQDLEAAAAATRTLWTEHREAADALGLLDAVVFLRERLTG